MDISKVCEVSEVTMRKIVSLAESVLPSLIFECVRRLEVELEKSYLLVKVLKLKEKFF
jgi:hypothetical protein